MHVCNILIFLHAMIALYCQFCIAYFMQIMPSIIHFLSEENFHTHKKIQTTRYWLVTNMFKPNPWFSSDWMLAGNGLSEDKKDKSDDGLHKLTWMI